MQRYRSVAELVSVDQEGWLRGRSLRQLPTKNSDHRPEGVLIDSLVIHHISLPERHHNPQPVLDFFLNRLDLNEYPMLKPLDQIRVSSHFLIDRSGLIYQFVSCLERAWHAGVSAAMGRSQFNDFSIGIELIGDEYSPFTATQMQTLIQLIRCLRKTYPLTYAFAHSEIAPGRKVDPGSFFSWDGIRKPHNFEIDLQSAS